MWTRTVSWDAEGESLLFLMSVTDISCAKYCDKWLHHVAILSLGGPTPSPLLSPNLRQWTEADEKLVA